MRIITISSLSLALMALVACGSTQSKDTAADGAKAAAEELKPWTALETPEEKGKFMQDVVVPAMAEVLHTHTGDNTIEVNCKSCHGQDPEAVGFKMPSPDLPALNPENFFAEHNPEMVQFMAEAVTPKMVEVLGVEPYNPETHQGFGCFACHTMKEMPAPIPSTDEGAEAADVEASDADAEATE